MVPERQAFHPSQKAVKAVADSTVTRPRRSRAKYRDNKTVEAKPLRPAQKRCRRVSTMDSLSDSKTSDGSDSCLEVPARRRRKKVSGSLESEVPGTHEPKDTTSRGAEDPVTKVLHDPASKGSDDRVTLVMEDPTSKGSEESMTQGLDELIAQVLDERVSKGLDEPVGRISDSLITPQSEVAASQSSELSISMSKQTGKGKNQVDKPSARQPKMKSNAKATPTRAPLFRSAGEAKQDHGSGERLLMRQWLESEANGGRIPGLQWLDKPNGLVRINWRHGSRAEWSTGDVTVFKCWSQHTGRLNSSAQDYKRWKANFRCALNSLPDVKEVKERRGTKAGDPYKVYQLLPAILPKKRRRESVKSARSSSPEEIIPVVATGTVTTETITTETITMETATATDVTPDEPMDSTFPLPPDLHPLSPDLFLQLMPLYSGAECRPVVTWSSGADLGCIPTSGNMENFVTMNTPLMCLDHSYTNAVESIVQRKPSPPPPPPLPPPPPAAPFNNAIPLPVQNLMDSDEDEEEVVEEEKEKEEEELQTLTLVPENLSEISIGELLSFADVQGGSVSSTIDPAALLLESVLQAFLLSNPGIIISTEAA